VDLAQDVPQGQVDAADGRRPHHVARVPEVLAEHHLPEVLDARGVVPQDELGHVFDGADHRPRTPFERGLAPAPQAVLIGADADEDPVPHAGVADQRFDGGDFHRLRVEG
jgi:hypothetical protein